MAYEEDMEKKVVDTLIGRCVTIRDLLGKSIALTHDIVGVPAEGESRDDGQTGTLLESLSSELRTIHARAAALLGQLERIKERLGPSSDD